METKDRNKELLFQIKEGKKNALEELVKNNMGLLHSIASRFKGRSSCEYEDLLQIGSIGMVKAAKSFDFSYDTAFSTYAVPLISGEIRRFLRDDGPVKVSRIQRQKGAELMAMKEKITAMKGEEPHLSELAEACRMTREEAAEALEAVSPVHSLDESVGEEGGTLMDFLSESENEIDKLTDTLNLKEAVSKLEEYQQKIVYLRYYKELSQEQTGRVLHFSQVKVSREEKKILEQLRKML